MSKSAKSRVARVPASLGRRVLWRALRDNRRLLPTLVVGDVIGERVRGVLTPKSRPATTTQADPDSVQD